MPGETMNDCRVMLKVCEGCGALWLRAAGPEGKQQGVYCSGCAKRLSEFPAVRLSRRGRKRGTVVRTAVCGGGAR